MQYSNVPNFRNPEAKFIDQIYVSCQEQGPR